MNELQGTEEWFADRRGKITSSRMLDVFRRSSRYLKQLRAERRGEIIDKPLEREPAPLAWGHKHEPMGRAAYELRFALNVRLVGFTHHPTVPYVGGSLDGMADPDGCIEVKCPIDEDVHLLTLGFGVPEQHILQIQSNLWVTGRRWCDFISFDPRQEPPMDLYVSRVPRDEKMIGAIAKACAGFWKMVLADNVEPIRRETSPYLIDGGIPSLF